MTMTAEDLLARAAECTRCRKVHQERVVRAHPVRHDTMRTTAAPDGHPYSPVLGPKTLERLRELIPAGNGTGTDGEPAREPEQTAEVTEPETAEVTEPETVTEPAEPAKRAAAAKPAARPRQQPVARSRAKRTATAR